MSRATREAPIKAPHFSQNKGFTLVEVVVSAAILVIIAVMVVGAFTTMLNVSLKTSEEKTSDSGLEEAIAAESVAGLDGYARVELTPAPLAFAVSGTDFSIALEAQQYTSEETGTSFTVFGYAASGSNP